ncbi:MAG: DUF167 domain-containing protein [Fibrobacteria bacterium]|nr:DUF167 domain-containing protein [Fibrobacteria bacterium]
MNPVWSELRAEGWLIRVKAVPGSSKDAIVGPLGDALKIRTSAAPEAGKANQAIASLLAAHLGVPPDSVKLASGPASPRKTFLVRGTPSWP